jgi:hypothetical protein
MKTSVSIDENSNLAMWFLGPNPKQIRVALTFENRGPVEIDFDEVSEVERKQLLRDIGAGKILSSVKYDVLRDHYRGQQKEPPTPTEEKKVILMEKIQKHQAKQAKIEERINYLLKQSARSVKSALKKEKSATILHAFRRREQTGKARKGILSFLDEKIKRIQEEAVKKSNANRMKQLIPKQFGGTDQYNVVESEQEIVQFSMAEPLTNQDGG